MVSANALRLARFKKRLREAKAAMQCLGDHLEEARKASSAGELARSAVLARAWASVLARELDALAVEASS